MNFLKLLSNVVVAGLLILAVLVTANIILRNNTLPEKSRESDLFWIDDNRLHKDSTISHSSIFDSTGEIIGSYIRVSYGENQIYIECLDTEELSWKESRDKWIINFKESLGE